VTLLCCTLGVSWAESPGISHEAENKVLELIAKYRTVEARERVFQDDGQGFHMDAVNYSARSNSLISGGWWQVDANTDTFTEGPLEGQTAIDVHSESQINYMVAVGKDIGDIMPISQYYHGPFLDYSIDMTRPGKYRLELNWTGQDNYTDSIYAYFLKPDGTLFTRHGPSFFLFHGHQSGWIWDQNGLKDRIRCAYAGRPDLAIWDFDEPGIYTLRLALREKGTAVAGIALVPFFHKDQAPRSLSDQYQRYPRRSVYHMSSRVSYNTETWGGGVGFEDNEPDQENNNTHSDQYQRYPRRSVVGMTSQSVYDPNTWGSGVGFE